MIDKMTVETQEVLEDKMYVCDECLALLTLRGALKKAFIIRVESKEQIKCDICGREAKFVLSPFKRGIWVCKECLEERGKKHIWMTFKIIRFEEEKVCDICLKKGAYLLLKEEG